jgi:hypothetical protein
MTIKVQRIAVVLFAPFQPWRFMVAREEIVT